MNDIMNDLWLRFGYQTVVIDWMISIGKLNRKLSIVEWNLSKQNSTFRASDYLWTSVMYPYPVQFSSRVLYSSYWLYMIHLATIGLHHKCFDHEFFHNVFPSSWFDFFALDCVIAASVIRNTISYWLIYVIVWVQSSVINLIFTVSLASWFIRLSQYPCWLDIALLIITTSWYIPLKISCKLISSNLVRFNICI
jgi:hypothetical protein